MKNIPSLFLSQAYRDCWDDYNRSLKLKKFPRWDYVILTASNEQQAEGFRKHLEERKSFLPKHTKFVAIPDRDGLRVGSGGATLEVLKYLRSKEESFEKLRVLVIHSGGDSKRVPQYSALGKLFSPVPHKLPNGRNSTLFDEFMICMSSVPSRIREGMVLLSGDVLLLFNPLQIDYNNVGAAAISFKEHVETGKNHGVYLNGENGNVKCCLQKKSVEVLRSVGAVNDSDCVDIDTGALIFSTEMMESLYSLIAAPEDYDRHVNAKTRLSLYADFLYPLAEDSTLEEFYKEKPEGEFCPELTAARERVWNVLRPYRMKLLRLAPAKFIHFGTTREILGLMNGGVDEYKDLGWSRIVGSSIKGDTAGYNSVLSSRSTIGEGCYLEISYVHRNSKIGDHCVLSYIEVSDREIPDNVVLHGLKQRDGSFVVRIFGIGDNPKENKLFGKDLNELEQKLGVRLWENSAHSLWEANLYAEADNIQDGVDAALNLYRIVNDESAADIEQWRNAEKKSLCSGFNAADPDAIIAWNKRMEDLVAMDEITKAIRHKVPAQKLQKRTTLTKIQREWLKKRLDKSDFGERMRLHYYLGVVLEDENEIQECFHIIQAEMLEATVKSLSYNENARIVTDRHTVNLPLRVNWGGGWSDTPPYCNENGGTVLNVAILLNGKKPVEVTLERIDELKIVFDSRDMDVHGEFDTIEPLQATGDPFDPFALQKACLLACGIIPQKGYKLEDILRRLGGGFVMHSEVTDVPKGSGLGTSSILSAACVKAVFEFTGIEFTEEDLYAHVLAMEQIMSTGGGWQDQVGGATPGLKYISSMPGLKQEIKVTHVEIPESARKELDERFVLIYTGQRRLARNLLRDVVGRYVGNEPDSLFALEEIQKTAALMRFELERGNVDGFAKLLDYHWELSEKVDAGSSNTLIEQIFSSIEEMIDGRLVCGAGGGGFLQVILKKGITREDVEKRLNEVFMDSLVGVADCKLVW
ncbi:bifunctional fucokinase/L-fucose-1-P-guanylyltransferase [Blautia obeum]|nr:bifunctional fucokinase/L-fucose-1-P-guanylyltransferase [Blautia obeum]